MQVSWLELEDACFQTQTPEALRVIFEPFLFSRHLKSQSELSQGLCASKD
jgi:hypothetical protein